MSVAAAAAECKSILLRHDAYWKSAGVPSVATRVKAIQSISAGATHEREVLQHCVENALVDEYTKQISLRIFDLTAELPLPSKAPQSTNLIQTLLSQNEAQIRSQLDEETQSKEARCPNPSCRSTDLHFETKQDRAADEGSTHHFVCLKCGHKFKMR
jgi:DNA-directed RNA polymerase subunit M/transcription elongation factor TFIIS